VALADYKPAVAREVLLLVAGLVWTGVGIMLGVWAAIWLSAVPLVLEIEMAAAGLVLALLAWWFMFRRLVQENIERIERAPLRACFFSFQAWKSYIVMVAMIGLGVVLRNSSLPKPWLAVVYAAIGGALFIASLAYHFEFWRKVRMQRR
jgi:hypothetical protein